MRPLGRSGRRRYRRKKTSGDRPVSQAHDESFISLLRWMKKDNHSSVDGDDHNSISLGLCEFQAIGRGMQALRDIKAGDKIISLPLRFLITVETVLSSYLGSIIKKCEEAFTPQALLTLYLSIEQSKGSSSYWSSYINTLPKTYSTPVYFSPGEIGLLNPRAKTLAMKAIEHFSAAQQKLMNFYKSSGLLNDFIVSDESLLWAWSTVETRSVFLETKSHPLVILEPDQSNVALAPFLDMLNHNDETEMKAGLNPDTNRYEIVTYTPYNKYSQVFISYGSHDNTRLLVNYGFVLPKNINNCYIFSLDDLRKCFPSLPHWNQKKEKLEESKLHRNLICDSDGVSWSLMTALKICALTWDELSSWKRLIQGGTVSPHNSQSASEMACQLVKIGLRDTRKHLNFIDSQPHTTHKNLIRTLAEDDVQILDYSFKALQARDN